MKCFNRKYGSNIAKEIETNIQLDVIRSQSHWPMANDHKKLQNSINNEATAAGNDITVIQDEV